MPPSSSTIPTVKAALITVLQNRAGLSGVQVSYSWLGPNTQPESIFLEGFAAHSEIPTQRAGRKDREESYTLDLRLRVINPAAGVGGAQTVEQRIFELLAEVDGALADDPKLGTTVLQWATLEDFEGEPVPVDDGWGYEIVAHIACKARLS